MIESRREDVALPAASGEALIELAGVGKQYPKLEQGGGRVRALWSMLRQKPADLPVYHALQDIDLSVHRGESLGLIGENGAGKSTLLKLVAGVMAPSTGRVRVNGRIGALLELGAGFHPEYTGRQNIQLAGALMGMGRQEMREHIESIIAFADIGDHIDQPIKHYSSGMVVRLGFAVATAMHPDVLITDEVLAVGDESFQKRCIAWIERYLSDGGTLLLCSHGMFHIQKLCQKAIWIHEGRSRMYGAAGEVTRAYLVHHEEKQRAAKAAADPGRQAGQYELTRFWLEDAVGNALSQVEVGADIVVQGQIRSPDGRVPVVAIGVLRLDGIPIFGVTSDIDGFRLNELNPALFGFSLILEHPNLLPGRYLVRAHAMDPEGMRHFDTMESIFDIVGDTRELGVCRLPHRWAAGRPVV
jgi:lipopolysaccharide transport system ATP-binding protein